MDHSYQDNDLHHRLGISRKLSAKTVGLTEGDSCADILLKGGNKGGKIGKIKGLTCINVFKRCMIYIKMIITITSIYLRWRILIRMTDLNQVWEN